MNEGDRAEITAYRDVTATIPIGSHAIKLKVYVARESRCNLN